MEEQRQKSTGFNIFYFIGIPLSVVLLLCTIILWVKLKQSESNYVQQQLRNAIQIATAPLKNNVYDTIGSLTRMGKRWQSSGGTPEKAWYDDANSLYTDTVSLQAVTFVDPQMRIKRIVPDKYKSYLNFDLSKITSRYELLKEAKEQKTVILSGLLQLLQGPKGFWIVNPLFVNSRFDGYLVMAINVNRLLEHYFEDGFGDNFGVTIYQDGIPIYQTGPHESKSDYVVEEKITFYNVTWDMHMWPTNAFLAKIESPLPDVVLASGTLVTLLVLIGFYFFYESKRSKQEVESLATRLQQILDTVNEGFITTDENLRLLYMNKYAEKMLGWKSTEVLGKNIQDIVIPERYREQHKAAIRKYFVDGDMSMMNKEIEFLAIDRLGREFPVEIILFPVKDKEHLYFHSFIKDISARKKSEMDQARFASIINASEDSILSTNLQGIIQTWNNGAHRLFGYTSEEAIGQPVSLIYENKDDMPKVLENLRHGNTMVIESTRMHKDGHSIPVSVIISPIRNAAGKVIGTSSITRDITEWKKIDKMKDEFISIVSHELRTPLTSIKGSLGILEIGKICPINDRAAQLLKIANTNCSRLIRLINDMLDIEKIASGKMNFNFKPINLYELLATTIEHIQGFANRNEVTIKLVGDKNVMIDGDPDKLMQVTTNLISNAINYSPRKGEIKITICKYIRTVRVSIQDQGPGIKAEFHDKIFGKFSQADSSDSRKMGGTGLGLSISKAIIEKHQGTIGFDTLLGKGTTFYFDLPYNGLDQGKDADEMKKGDQSINILICDRNFDNADLIRSMLSERNIHSDIANTTKEADHLLQINHYDAITIDLSLPEEDGLSYIRRLRQQPKTRAIPIVVISVEVDHNKKALNGDGFLVLDWIEKPVSKEQIKNIVDHIIKLNSHRTPNILSVEDDPDVVQVLTILLQDKANVLGAKTIKEAQEMINKTSFDLIILDLNMPDGLGTSLLPCINRETKQPIPVVVFSIDELDKKYSHLVKQSLLKSVVSNEQLFLAIETAIQSGSQQ